MNFDDKTKIRFLNYFGYFITIIFVFFIFGVINDTPKFILEINFVIKIIISLYLIYRFNSFRETYLGSTKTEFTEFDRKLVYSSSVYIIILSFFDIFVIYLNKIRSIISGIFQPVTEPLKKSIGYLM
jgi:hypothetical protein